MWKFQILSVLLVVLVSCYAEESSTTATTSNSTSGIEKEGDGIIPNLPPHVRMMPYTRHQSGQPGAGTLNPGAGSAVNSRPRSQAPAYIPQSSTPSYREPVDGNRAVPVQATARQGRQNTNIADDANMYQNPRTGFGNRADGIRNPQEERISNINREEENGFHAPAGARSSQVTRYSNSPRGIGGREDNVGEYLGSRQGSDPVDGSIRSMHWGAGSEMPYDVPQPSVQSGRPLAVDQDTGSQELSSSRGLPSGDFGQPAGRRIIPANRQMPGLNIPVTSRDRVGVQPRQGGQPVDDNSIFPPGQGPRVGYDGTWTSYRRYGVDSQDPGVLYSAPEEHQHRAYSFNYLSESEEGMHGHQQTADESGKVIGSYAISLGDGRKRIVEYIADENGFRASIDTNEPGTRNDENPADIVYYNTPETAGRRATFQGLQDFQISRSGPGSSSRVPSAPTSGGVPFYRSQDAPREEPTAVRSQEDSENRIRQPTSGVAQDIPRYGSSPRLPVRRRLQDPQDDEFNRNARSQASPATSRSQSNRQNTESQPEIVNAPRSEERISRVPVRSPVVPRTQGPSVPLSTYGNQGAQLDRMPETPMYRNPQPDPVAAEPSSFDSDRPAEESFVAGSPYNANDSGNRFWFYRN